MAVKIAMSVSALHDAILPKVRFMSPLSEIKLCGASSFPQIQDLVGKRLLGLELLYFKEKGTNLRYLWDQDVSPNKKISPKAVKVLWQSNFSVNKIWNSILMRFKPTILFQKISLAEILVLERWSRTSKALPLSRLI